MGFRQGAYAKVWSTEDKGNYSTGKVSISRKNKETNRYDVEFIDNFVRFVGSAHTAVKDLAIGDKGVTIRITSCDVTNRYDAEKKRTYTNFVIFGFELPDNNYSGAKPEVAKPKPKPEPANDSDDDDLPF